jgi:hypothetical protein
MNYAKGLKHIQESGILAQWQWSQDVWDSFSGKHTKSYSWKSEWKRIAIPLFLVICLGLVPVLTKDSSKTTNVTNYFNGYTFIDIVKIAWLPLLIAILIITPLYLIIRGSARNGGPSPKVKQTPQVILGKEGVIVGNTAYLWQPPEKRVSNIEFHEETETPYFQMDISWAFGIEKIIVPVPIDKLAEAKNAINEIQLWSKQQKYGTEI